MRHLFGLLVCLLLGLVGHEACAEGGASVGAAAAPTVLISAEPWLNRGVWTESVSLDLPPGPGGLVPGVALLADPGAREGLLGFGWTLSGLSRIERRGLTGGVPTFTDPSSFRLDGQDLYLNADTGCYEPEQQDGRCVGYDPFTNTWTVRLDGTTWTYGALEGSGAAVGLYASETPPSSQDETAQWLLASVEDRFGHRILWEYASELLYDSPLSGTALSWSTQSHPVPVRVTWGAAELYFDYEDRPDWRLDASSGGMLVWDQRLIGLETRVNGAFYSAYGLEYAESDRQSLVQQVSRISADGKVKYLRTLTLADQDEGWDTDGEDLSAQLPYPFGTLFSDWGGYDKADQSWNRWSVANLNGDARPDLVLISTACLSVDGSVDDVYETSDFAVTDLGFVQNCASQAMAWVNQPSSPALPGVANGSAPQFVEDVEWTTRLSSIFGDQTPLGWTLADIDRDGWTDLLYEDPNNGDVKLLRFDPWTRTFETTSLTLDPELLRQGQIADLDGDGLPDLLVPAYAEEDGLWIRNTGIEGAWFDGVEEGLTLPLDDDSLATSPPDDWPTGCTAEGYPQHGEEGWSHGQTYRNAQARLLDLNGDGVLDVAYALYTCWDPYTESSGGETPQEWSAYSRIFYGDGRGGFYDSGLSAGEPWLIAVEPGGITAFNHHSNNHMQVLDVDRSGSLALLQYAGVDDDEVVVLGGYDRGLLSGFLPDWSEWPADFDPEISALGGRYPHESQVLFADFDGDGFPDQLRLSADRDDENDLQEAPIWSVTWHQNTRSDTQGRITAMLGPWGGLTELSWGFTGNRSGNNGGVEEGIWALEDEDAPNRYLHTNQEVLVGMDGEQGLVQYRYLHGFHDGERFRGFGVVERSDAYGRVEHGFAVSLALSGAGLYVARYRADDTLSSFLLNLHLTNGVLSPSLPSGDSWGLDIEAPYFNPMTRQCSFDVGASGADPLDLVAECLFFDRISPDTPDVGELLAAAGFVAYGDLAERVWQGDPSDDVEAVVFGAWGGEEALGFSSGPESSEDERETPISSSWSLPDRPATPESPPDSSHTLHVTAWSYHPNGQLAWTGQHRDSSTDLDDLETWYTWSDRDTSAWGYSLLSTVTTDRFGAQQEQVTRSNFVSGAFDLPQTLTRCGRSASACVTLGQSWSDSSGMPGAITSLSYPDGSSEAWEYDADCGALTRHSDRIGRVTKTRTDSLCRRDQVLAEGARSTWDYDGFNRIITETHDPDATDGLSHDTVTTWSFYEDLGAMPISAEVYADKATLNSAGRVDWLSVDGWGREVYTASCPGERSGSGVVCTGDVLVSGSLRLESGLVGWKLLPHFDGQEEAAFIALTYDEQGRVVASSAPSSAEDGQRAEISTLYAPGREVRTNPHGVEEEVLFDTLGSETWRAGVFRGALERDAWGHTLRETDAAGVVNEYEYDDHHRLALERLSYDPSLSPSTQDGCVSASATTPTEAACTREWTHSYDIVGRTHSITDPQGTITVLFYDAVDRLLKRNVAGTVIERGKFQDWSSSAPASATLTDEAGASFTQTFDGWGRVSTSEDISGSSTTVYAEDGLPRLSVDPNGRSLYQEHDVWGQVIALCYASGWDSGAERCTSPLAAYDYDGAGRLTQSTDADGVVTEAIWSPAGQLLELWQGPYLLESHTYDVLGRVIVSRLEGVEQTWSYDDLDRPTEQVTGSSDKWRAWTWNDADQLITETQGPVQGAEASTSYSYDALGQLRAVVHPGATSPTEHFTYDALGRLRFNEDEVGAIARRDYDSLGRVTFQRIPGEGETRFTYKLGVTWDDTDHLTRVRETDGEGHVTDRYLDALGRVQGEVLPNNSFLRAVYVGIDDIATRHHRSDGSLLAAQVRNYEPETGLLSTVYDWFLSENGLPGGADYAVSYEWTPAGRLSSLDAAGERSEFFYDHGLLSVESWDDGVQTRAFGRSGRDPRIVSETWTGSDGVSQRLRSLTYDAAGRLSAESVSDTWTGQTLENTWSGYDAYDQPGEVTRSIDGSEVSAEVWSYDKRGWPATRQTWLEGSSIGSMSWSWYDNGALKTQTTPSGRTLRHVRALSGNHHLLQRLEADGATVAEITRRDKNLRPTRLSLGGGRQTLGLRYDELGHLDKKWASSGLDATAITWEGFYDERGRLTEEQTTDLNGTQLSTYAYSEPGWLNFESHERGGTWSAFYQHDTAGNRVETWVDGVRQDELTWNGSVLNDVSGTPQVYDPFDGLEDDGERFYAHEPDGELSAIEDEETYTRILRDPSGRPVLTADSEGETLAHFGLGHGALPIETETPEGSILELSVEGIRLGQLRGNSTKPLPVFTDPKGSVLQHGAEPLPAFGAFGDRVSGPSTHEERHLYAGLTSLPDAPDVLLAQHRAYHPRTGRFLSPDPIGLLGGLHRSRYANNNPVSFSDPTGWSPQPNLSDASSVWEPPSQPTEGGESTQRDPQEVTPWCSAAPASCAGNQAGMDRERWKKFTILQQDTGDSDVDAEASARDRRAERRAGRRVEGQGPSPELGSSTGTGREPGAFATIEMEDGTTQVYYEPYVVEITERRTLAQWLRGGFNRVGDSLQRGWEGFKQRHENAPSAAWNGTQAAFGYYVADSIETFGGMMQPSDYNPMRAAYDQAVQWMGDPDFATGWKTWANEQYLEGNRQDPSAVYAGAVMSTIVVAAGDVLMPGPTGEGKAVAKVGIKGRELAGQVARGVDEAWEGVTEASRFNRTRPAVSRAGKPFTPAGKAKIDAENAAANGGVNVCESCGTQVVSGTRSQRGVSPPGNERQRDHIVPKSKGGEGDPANGQILCRDCNLNKSDSIQ